MSRRTFRRYTLDEYIVQVVKPAIAKGVVFPQIHVHGTWKPTKADYYKARDKEWIIQAMWRFHTGVQKWSDIGQHATIDPDGYIWEGRSLFSPPASATGFNDPDNDNQHPFMYEMIGNFDRNCERLEGPQLKSAAGLTYAIMKLMHRGTEIIRFHNDMTNAKTCPGSGIDKGWFITQVIKEALPVQILYETEANKIIDILQAAWGNAATAEAKNEIHRLANEIRKAAGIRLT